MISMIHYKMKKMVVAFSGSTLAMLIVSIILIASVGSIVSAYTTLGTNNRKGTDGHSANRDGVKALNNFFRDNPPPHLSQRQLDYHEREEADSPHMRKTGGMDRDDFLLEVHRNQPQHLYVLTHYHDESNQRHKNLFVGKSSTEYVNATLEHWLEIETVVQEDKFYSALPGSVVFLFARGIAQNVQLGSTFHQVWGHLTPAILVGPRDNVWRSSDSEDFMKKYSSELKSGATYREAIQNALTEAKKNGRALQLTEYYNEYDYSATDYIYMKLSGERYDYADQNFPYEYLSKEEDAVLDWERSNCYLQNSEIAGGYLNFHISSQQPSGSKINVEIVKNPDSQQSYTVLDQTYEFNDVYISPSNKYAGAQLFSYYLSYTQITAGTSKLQFIVTHDLSSSSDYVYLKDFEFVIIGK